MALFEGFRPQGEALVLLLIIYCSEIFCFFPVCRLANLMFYSRVKHSGTIISAPGESELKAPSRSDSIRIILGRDCFYCLNQCPEIAQTSHILLPCRRGGGTGIDRGGRKGGSPFRSSRAYKEAGPLSVIRPALFSAERGGFEPPVRSPVRQFSKLLV